MTKAQFRTELRSRIGDEIKLSGAATSGSTFSLVSTVLQQPDSHWDGMELHITGTGDSNAPKGESRKIAQSTFADTSVRVELPFTAAIESGDSFSISVFSDARIDQAVRKTLKEFSLLRPLDFNEPLTVTSGNKRFSPTSAADILSVSKIEYYNQPTQEHFGYDNWTWLTSIKQIEFNFWWSESKTLTLHGLKYHTYPSAEATEHTVETHDLDNFLDLCTVNFLLEITEAEFYDKFGMMTPSLIKKKDITYDYKGMREFLVSHQRSIRAKIKGEYHVPLSAQVGARISNIDKKMEPDGWFPEPIFWEVK